MLTLILATPSPFARMNCIAMLEKAILFDLRSEILWHLDTQMPAYNLLEMLPILLFDDGRNLSTTSFTSKSTLCELDYADQNFTLLPGDLDMDL